MSARALELAEEIRRAGRRSPQELLPLISQAEQLANDTSDPFIRGVSVRAAGSAHQMLNSFPAALERYDSAVSCFEQAGDSAQVGRTLLAKIGPLASLGRLDELFECASRARVLFESHHDTAGLARLNVNLGNVYTRRDYLHEALECYEKAFPTLEELADDEALVAASMNAAVVLTSLHRFDEANRRYERAAAIAHRMDMGLLELQCRYNQTYLGYLRGDSGRALGGFRRLRETFERHSDRQHVCLCWLSEAEVLLELGDLGETLRSARTAYRHARDLGLNHEAGKALLFEGIVLLRNGRRARAIESLRRARERFDAEGNNVWTAVSQLQTALFCGEAEREATLRLAVAARQTLQDRRLTHWVALAEIVIGRLERAAGSDDPARDSFRRAVEAAEATDSRWMQFHACHELGRSLLGSDESSGIGYLRQAESLLDGLWDRIGSDELKLAFLSDRESVYTRLVSSVASRDVAEAFRLSDKSRSRVLIERLAPGDRTAADDIPAWLDPDETIVEYFVAGDDLYIFTADTDGLEAVHRPGVMPSVVLEWQHLERHLASCSVAWERLNRVRTQLEDTARAHLSSLHNHLVAPVRSRLRRRLVVVPHGCLHGIPFQALVDDDGGYLSDDHLVAYSPSARLYASRHAPRDANGHSPSGGGLPPSGGGLPPSGGGLPLFIAFSPGSGDGIVDEIEQAAARFDGGSQVLINPSVGALERELSVSRPLVHIAGHAGIDPVQGALAWLETPGGRLTSRDLIRMRFRADTIVVTGCHTARRTISAGDEWLGLMRAFYLSGARTVVSAHWAIRDESARLFSANFYEAYDPLSPETAVRAGTRAIRNQFPHPYFWAGFGTFIRKRGGCST